MSAKTDAAVKARVDYEGTGKAKEARVWLDLEAGLSEREFIEYMVAFKMNKDVEKLAARLEKLHDPCIEEGGCTFGFQYNEDREYGYEAVARILLDQRAAVAMNCLCGCGEPTGRKSHRWIPGHNPLFGQPCLCGCGKPTVRGNQKWLAGHRDNIRQGNISADRALEIALGSPPRLRFQKPKGE